MAASAASAAAVALAALPVSFPPDAWEWEHLIEDIWASVEAFSAAPKRRSLSRNDLPAPATVANWLRRAPGLDEHKGGRGVDPSTWLSRWVAGVVAGDALPATAQEPRAHSDAALAWAGRQTEDQAHARLLSGVAALAVVDATNFRVALDPCWGPGLVPQVTARALGFLASAAALLPPESGVASVTAGPDEVSEDEEPPGQDQVLAPALGDPAVLAAAMGSASRPPMGSAPDGGAGGDDPLRELAANSAYGHVSRERFVRSGGSIGSREARSFAALAGKGISAREVMSHAMAILTPAALESSRDAMAWGAPSNARTGPRRASGVWSRLPHLSGACRLASPESRSIGRSSSPQRPRP